MHFYLVFQFKNRNNIIRILTEKFKNFHRNMRNHDKSGMNPLYWDILLALANFFLLFVFVSFAASENKNHLEI